MTLCSFCRKPFANSSVAKRHEKQDCQLAQLGVKSGFKRRQARLEAAKRAISRRNSRNSSAADIVRLKPFESYEYRIDLSVFTARTRVSGYSRFTAYVYIAPFETEIPVPR